MSVHSALMDPTVPVLLSISIVCGKKPLDLNDLSKQISTRKELTLMDFIIIYQNEEREKI